MVQYIKKRKFKNDNRFKYVYYKIDGKTKKRVSSKEYYKNKKNKKYIGGNKYKGVSTLKTEDNSPIDGSIKQITRVDKNLIENQEYTYEGELHYHYICGHPILAIPFVLLFDLNLGYKMLTLFWTIMFIIISCPVHYQSWELVILM